MNYSYGRSVWLLIAVVVVALFIGYFPALVLAALLILAEPVQWIKDYKKNQTDYDNSMNIRLESLKYKNEQNKQKGKQNDNQS